MTGIPGRRCQHVLVEWGGIERRCPIDTDGGPFCRRHLHPPSCFPCRGTGLVQWAGCGGICPADQETP